MSASASPNPSNLLILAALGIGVFWFMTRRGYAAVPSVIYPTPAQNQQAYGNSAEAVKYQVLGGLAGKAFDFFATKASGENPYSLAAGVPNVAGTLSLYDGVPYNPSGNVSAFDSIYSLAYKG